MGESFQDNTMGDGFQDFPWIQDSEATFPLKGNLKKLN